MSATKLALAALGRFDQARAALARATEARDRAFADEPITRSVLALARVSQGQVEALAPVLTLPSPQRIHQIVISVERVRTALSASKDPGRDTIELAGAIEGWISQRLTQPQ